MLHVVHRYGGSTAAVAAGLAVLRILLRDNMQQHAQQVGSLRGGGGGARGPRMDTLGVFGTGEAGMGSKRRAVCIWHTA